MRPGTRASASCAARRLRGLRGAARMTKRRAGDALQHHAPFKRPAGPACGAEARPSAAPASRGPAAPLPVPALEAAGAAWTGIREKRPRAREEPEAPETPLPRKKARVSSERVSRNGAALAHSGSFQDENNAVGEAAALILAAGAPESPQEEGAAPNNVTKCEKGVPTDDDDLSAFNSFQFWRAPLPDLDFSVLQCDDGEPARKNSMLLEGDAMET